MRLKKLLFVITIIVITMLSLMLATSYAWYSFENGSTTFDAVTNNDSIIVSYQTGEYINTDIAVPISSSEIDKYSSKTNFNVRINDNVKDNDVKVEVKLTDVNIAYELKNSSFYVDLFYQGTKVRTVTGDYINSGVDVTLGSMVLNNNVDNLFEVRVYILSDGNTYQNDMMNKTFSAKIKVDVVSRLKTEFKDYKDNPDIYISNITIDGESSDSLPTSGYYDMTATCEKGSVLTWDSTWKTITYKSGSKINDSCSLVFTTDEDPEYVYLNEMPVGSYVKYEGNNGCPEGHCDGTNANYVDDDNMGYCDNSSYKFYYNGWRIGYIDNGNVHLISGGAPECVATYVDSKNTSTSYTSFNSSYKYGSTYTFNKETGEFTLSGNVSTFTWSSSTSSNILANYKYTCRNSSGTCTQLYELSSSYSNTQAYYYYHYNYETTIGAPLHIENLNNTALKYCNSSYAKGGVCNDKTAWAMKASDFEEITGSVLSSSSCYGSSSRSCGLWNSLIDNGGYYWFATPYNSASSNEVFYWYPSGRVDNGYSSIVLGVRPVLSLESSVKVTGGTGTYEDPYTIDT